MRNPFNAPRRCPGRNTLALVFWWTFIAFLVRTFWQIIYRLQYLGVENIPSAGPVIYVANHQSHFDPPLIGSIVRDRPFSPMARQSLFRIPGLAWFMRTIGTIPLKRGGAGDKAALSRAIDELAAGRAVLIFPEGTRTKSGAIGVFKPGVMLLVKRAQADVVPVAIEGAFDIWPAHASAPAARGTIMVRVGSPIRAQSLLSLPVNDALDRLKRQIESMRLDLRARIRARTGNLLPAPGPADAPYWSA